MKYVARYGAMRIQGIFTFPVEERLRHGDRVVVHTLRGHEVGVILCVATEEIEAAMGADVVLDRVIRLATSGDEAELRRIRNIEREEFLRCREVVGQMNIMMDLVRVEHIFGGERMIVYYVAEGRIDFRELVKLLASEFQMRIEMRQIGVRDETRLLADFGDCGLEVCCNLYLNDMSPISMKMAKLQKTTLDPNKVSGRCGRLKCCLRYEHDHYVETQKKLPPIGAEVITVAGEGKVIGHELLVNKVWVEIPESGKKLFCAAAIRLKWDLIEIQGTNNKNCTNNENE
ncbi:MAG: signal peptidase [Planctomycetaceae bacterium]|nr:signal peptidase [Planctomycetaceae bacterium]